MSSVPSSDSGALRVGVVGAGALGRAFCGRLAKLGVTPVVFDVAQASLDAAEDAGAVRAVSARDVASRSDFIITVLPYSADVEDALFGANGIVEGSSRHTVVIEASTIDPRAETVFAQRLELCGAKLLDVGVSASPRLLSEGRGGALVGGADDVFTRCEPLLSQLFAEGTVVLVGEVGAGKTVKLISNMVGAVQVVALSEAFELGHRAGIELGPLYEGLKVGMANCWALHVRPPAAGLVPNSPADTHFEPDYPLDYMLKDLDYFRAVAQRVGAATLISGIVRDIYGYASLAGVGHLDFAAVSLLPNTLRQGPGAEFATVKRGRPA